MKVIETGKYLAVTALLSLLLASPALAQDPDCTSAASRQYGPNCDDTEVTVFEPNEPPVNPPVDPPDDGLDDEADVVIISPGDLDDEEDIVVSPAAPVVAPAAPSGEAASASYPGAAPVASAEAEGSTVAMLPDTGGEGWLVTAIGGAMVGIAVFLRRVIRA